MTQKKTWTVWKTIGVVCSLLLALMLVVMAIGQFALPKQVIGDGLARNVNTTLTWSNIPVNVGVQVSPRVPACNASGQPVDVILVMDVSSSMIGTPLQRGYEAMRRFGQGVDPTRTQVGVVLFSDAIEDTLPLTSDNTAIESFLNKVVRNGGTSIHLGLAEARNQLKNSKRQAASSAVIILLSDGGSDENAAIAQATAAQQDKISIVSIGLASSGLNSVLLQKVATTGIYREAQSPDDLLKIYTDLGGQLNQIAGTNLVAREPVNPIWRVDALTGLNNTGNRLELRQPWVSSQSGAAASYRVSTTQIGLHEVVMAGGDSTFTTCDNQALSTQSVAGPQVMVLPPAFIWWPLLLLLALLGVLPFTSFSLFSRKETSKPTDIIAPTDRRRSAEQEYQDWVANAQNSTAKAEPETPLWVRTRPMVIVGIGQAGQITLNHITQYLIGRCGQDWARRLPHIKLINIEIIDSASNETKESNPERTDLPGLIQVDLSISPDRRNRLNWHSGLAWFGDAKTRMARLRSLGRAMGRLAVFSNLAEGVGESKLWRTLNGVLSGQTNTSIYIVSDSFSDQASGAIGDIGHLVRHHIQDRGGRLTLCLAAHNAEWDSKLGLQERQGRTFATLREIQRLQRRQPVRWQYLTTANEPALDSSSDIQLFDEIMVFEGVSENKRDLTSQHPRVGILSSLAGNLISLLDRNVSERFYQTSVNELTRMVRQAAHAAENAEYVIGSMGSYAIRLPIDELRCIMQWRLVHKCLFDPQVGILGAETLPVQGDGNPMPAIMPVLISPFTLEQLFDEEGLMLAQASAMTENDALRHLQNFTEVHLNERKKFQANAPLGSLQTLRPIEVFLRKVATESPIAWQVAARQLLGSLHEWLKLGVGFVAPVLPAIVAAGDSSAVPSASSAVGSRREKLRARKTTTDSEVLGMDEQDNSHQSPAPAIPAKLYALWETEWRSSRAALKHASDLQSQRLVLGLADEPKLYDSIIPDLNRVITEIQGRMWWRWHRNGNAAPVLGLIVLPDDLNQPSEINQMRRQRDMLSKDWQQVYFLPTQTAKIMQRIAALAYAYTQPLSLMTLDAVLDQQALTMAALADDLERFASPMCRRRVPDGTTWTTISSFRYFARPNSERMREVGDALIGMQNPVAKAGSEVIRDTYELQQLDSQNNAECRLMHVKHVLPLHYTDIYDEARNNYRPRADLHVWEIERNAAETEAKIKARLKQGGALVFSPKMAALWLQNPKACLTFAKAIIYQSIKLDPTGYHFQPLPQKLTERAPQLEPWLKQSPQEAIAGVLATPAIVEALEADLPQIRPTDVNARQAKLNEFRDDVMQTWGDVDLKEGLSAIARVDLLLLLHTALAHEEKDDNDENIAAG